MTATRMDLAEDDRGTLVRRPDMMTDLMKIASLSDSVNLREVAEEQEDPAEAAEDSALRAVHQSVMVGDRGVRKKELFSWSMALIVIK